MTKDIIKEILKTYKEQKLTKEDINKMFECFEKDLKDKYPKRFIKNEH
jgi:Glu-tRNA(Gln) amidotransferase subunit E-like FAD-binding protein